MDALKLLQKRVSVSKVTQPAPSKADLIEVFKAASRAADHGKLRPWHFLAIEGEGLNDLSNLLVTALTKANPDVSPSVVEKTKNLPFRAPMIIVSIAKCQEHPSIPKHEQRLACGAATQNMLNALFALGFGAIWKTGDLAYNEVVIEGLGLAPSDEIIGFIYVGTPAQDISEPPEVDVNSIFSVWPTK
ncbi:MAG: nitroreductase [Gammaproteobacteria bacterium]|nr:MAG: nitroreductase [Gammaproteobacteria bacterium]